MKRSDALKAIRKLLDDHRPFGCDLECQILDILEGCGMLPPKIKNPKYNSDDAMKYSEHPFLEYDIPYNVNEWEKE